MKKGILFLAALVLLTTLVLPMSTFANADRTRDVQGTLTSIQGNKIGIRPHTGATVVLRVRAKTRIFVNDQPAQLSDLHLGDAIDAHYLAIKMVATRVDKQTGN